MALDKPFVLTDNVIGSIGRSTGRSMGEPAEDRSLPIRVAQDPTRRRRIVVVSGDREFAESLRGQLAIAFDVLLARNAGEAAAKAQAVSVDMVIVDLGVPVLGVPALTRMREFEYVPVICGLTPVADPTSARSIFDFDFVLARPTSAAELPDRIRFILAKVEGRNGG